MARINTNVPSLVAQRNLHRSNADLALRLERLSTGLRINRGSDDPAGLIVSERLRSELKGLDQAISNSERAISVIATTEGYLAEVNDLLNSVRGLVVEAANTGGLSLAEIQANQLQVDSAIDSITRISNTASFGGLKLLDGSLEYLVSGLPTSAISGAAIHSAQFGSNPSVPVNVEVIGSAQTAQLFLSGNTAGAPGALLSSVTIEIAGNQGVQALTFVSGAALSAVVAAVNTYRDTTGVSASLVSATDQTSGLVLHSIGYGSDAFVSARKIGQGGDFFRMHPAQGDATVIQRDEGQDVQAVINGVLATGRGLDVTINSPSLALEMNLTSDFATLPGTQKSFDITGGGVVFQLGTRVNTNQQVGIGIQSVAATHIGGSMFNGARFFLDSIKSGGANSIVDGESEKASRILDAAISEITEMRGRLGAFERNTLATNIRSLQVGVENISSSESKVRDADFAEETARLTRAQILTQAGTSILATANISSQNVLSLLG